MILYYAINVINMPVNVGDIKDDVESAGSRRKNRGQEVLDLLEETGEAMDQAEISERLDMSDSHANQVLRKLTKNKKLVRFNHEREDGRTTIHYARAVEFDEDVRNRLWKNDSIEVGEDDDEEEDDE